MNFIFILHRSNGFSNHHIDDWKTSAFAPTPTRILYCIDKHIIVCHFNLKLFLNWIQSIIWFDVVYLSGNSVKIKALARDEERIIFRKHQPMVHRSGDWDALLTCCELLYWLYLNYYTDPCLQVREYVCRLNSHAIKETSRRSHTAICSNIYLLLRVELFIE